MNTITSASMLISNVGSEARVNSGNVEQTKFSEVETKRPADTQADVKAPSAAEVENALSVVNKAAVFEQRSLSFMVDEASGRSIIKVIDRSNDQLIRQIPSEELLKVAQDIKKLQEEMGQSLGFLVDRKV
ncbi:flagellar protein FlaG [Rheinheimera sp. UJ63]|uniref:flagellar protein FlaG n=1 Tax=Rheinheimera sp. UJ63 TaxID=2910157 RepID=UPI001F35AB57|nr:flagellar protein FlaG [Rheinheimera sp. UJ63]MCF4009077.1 flagellar protein FlaG [Rheinheimera sp. UJ63]